MTLAVRPRFVPIPYQDATESGRLILRDGTTAQIRVAVPEDHEAVLAFFRRLSPESRRRRFFSGSLPNSELIGTLCSSSNPGSVLTLVVSRTVEDESRIVATGSYLAKTDKTAEVAFAVDDALQGKGLGTLLLERLALLAVRHGFKRFWAVTHADNKPMRDVFRESGYAVDEKFEGGEIEVDLSVIPSASSVSRLEMRDRVATTASLRPFFWPKSVAVIGASRDLSSIGFRVVQALVVNRFKGPIYPVNPNASEIGRLRAYPSVRAIPEPVELAIIAVPRDIVLQVVDNCAEHGVQALVVITAGFAEVGPEGKELQKKLVDKVRGYGMRMVGPNCMGLVNTDPKVQLNASFSPVFPPPGRVAMSSQSGALGLAILSAARRLNLGLSTFVSVGNKADVSGNDLLQYWEEDPGTDVILLYLESFGNPRRFARIARRVSQRKPIVAIKSGRTKAGGRAAGSHTASLAGSDIAVDALFRQTGVIRAETLEEMFDLALALGSQSLPAGPRVGIITNAGGPGILCADMCEASGLVIPEISSRTRDQLRAFLPPAASLTNPIDLIASATPSQYRQAIQTVLASDEVDGLIVIYIPAGLAENRAVQDAIQAAVTSTRTSGPAAKPVIVNLMTDEGTSTLLDLESERVPCFAFPETAARVLGKVCAYGDWRAQPQGTIPDFVDLDLGSARKVIETARQEFGGGWLSAGETRTLLQAFRLPVPPGGLARNSEEAIALALRIGYPVALKLASRQLVHKTEIGGVRLNLNRPEAVRTAFAEIQNSLHREGKIDLMEGVLVQPMISGGVEVMMGMTQDTLFGPLLAFGLGGIHVEILSDVCFRVTPLTDRDAAEMVRSIKGFRLLEGYRGHPPADIEALQHTLLRLSRLVEEFPEITELDLNPVFALIPGQGCQIADARIKV